MKVNERHEIEYGVRRADGTVQLMGPNLVNARERAKQLDNMAESLRVPERAKIVRRRKVTRVEATPWEGLA